MIQYGLISVHSKVIIDLIIGFILFGFKLKLLEDKSVMVYMFYYDSITENCIKTFITVFDVFVITRIQAYRRIRDRFRS